LYGTNVTGPARSDSLADAPLLSGTSIAQPSDDRQTAAGR